MAFRSLRPALVVGLLAGCGGGGEKGTPVGPLPGPPSVTTIAFSPAADTLFVTDVVSISATPKDSAGNTLTGRTTTWASSDTAIVSVNGFGQVGARALGAAFIRATISGKTDSARILVVPVIVPSPLEPSLFATDTVQILTVFRDGGGNPLGASPATTFVSRSPGTAAVTAAGLVTGVAPGTATIVVTAAGGSESLDVVVLAPVVRPNREISFLRGSRVPGRNGIIVDILSADRATVAPLIPDSENVFAYRWSPDGKRIAAGLLTLNGAGHAGGWLLDSTGAFGPALGLSGLFVDWLPGGNRVVGTNAGANDIASVSLPTLNKQVLGPRTGQEVEPHYSPDGRRIAFRYDPAFTGTELYVMRADGTGGAGVAAVQVLAWEHYAWSPDGRLIGFERIGAGVWTVDTYRGTLRQVLAGAVGPVTWSPDGTRLAFANAAHTQLFVAARHGPATPIVTGTGVQLPQWSPDGTQIAFVMIRADTVAPNVTSIFTVGPTGTGLTRAVPTNGAGLPQWRP